MDSERLSRFGSAVKERATAVWIALWARYWPHVKKISLDAWRRSAQAREWISKHPNFAIAPAVIVAILFLLIAGQLAVAATLIGAWFALARGISQAAADFRRRINETYNKAVSQLASDKLEERLGGIYTLENVSTESPDDYWTVMETLTAFVRERSQRNEVERMSQDAEQRIRRRAHLLWQEAGRPDGQAEKFWADATKQDEIGDPPATDIAAVLTVIKRRSEWSRERENTYGWHLDFSQAVLKQANLRAAYLERADFKGARLERANLRAAHLEGADLRAAHLEGADLSGAHFEGTSVRGAHFEGADLRHVSNLSGDQLLSAYGNAATRLSAGVAKSPHWPGRRPMPGPPNP